MATVMRVAGDEEAISTAARAMVTATMVAGELVMVTATRVGEGGG